MAPARVTSLGLGVVLFMVGCGPTSAASVEPDSAVSIAELPALSGDEATPEPRATDAEPGGGSGFLVTLESRCRDVWSGKLVRGDDAAEKLGIFEIKSADAHELQMQPGDALVLTSPRGGMMAVEFDNITTGYKAHVEVSSDCTGVKRSLARQTAAR